MVLTGEAKKNYDRLYYLNNRDHILKKVDQYRKDNREDHNRRSKNWRIKNPEKYRITLRNCQLKRKYGITLLEWQQLFESQNCQCAICGTDKEPKNGWHTDHIHGTKIVRGILCNNCNISIHNGDTPELLRKKADYLEKNGY